MIPIGGPAFHSILLLFWDSVITNKVLTRGVLSCYFRPNLQVERALFMHLFVILCALLASALSAQQGQAVLSNTLTGAKEQPSAAGPQRVSPEHLYTRIMAVVPMIGTGKADDPKRPMFAPSPVEIGKLTREGIIGMSYQLSDDGKFAIVEYVAANPAALRPILAANAAASLKAFERGKSTITDVETEFRKFKKDFNYDRFAHAMPH